MKTGIGALLAVAFIAACAAVLGMRLLLSNESTENLDRGDLQQQVDDLTLRLDETKGERDRLRRDLAALGRETPVAVSSGSELSEQAVETIVRRILAESDRPQADSSPQGPKPEADEQIDSLIARLKNPNLSSFERSQIIDALARAGRVDEVIAMMAEAAKADPNNPDRKVDVALSLLSKLRNGKVSQMEQATLGMAADKALDEALALDDQHWDARFNKAISLSFWPPVMGKQPEAISHFETLIEQQGRGAPEPQHAQTHLWLGNLYQQSGKSELAQQTWAAGLALFPGNEELQARLGQ